MPANQSSGVAARAASAEISAAVLADMSNRKKKEYKEKLRLEMCLYLNMPNKLKESHDLKKYLRGNLRLKCWLSPDTVLRLITLHIVFSLDVFPGNTPPNRLFSPVWVLSGFSSLLPQPKEMHVMLIGSTGCPALDIIKLLPPAENLYHTSISESC